MEPDFGVGVCGGIIEEAVHILVGFLRWVCLLSRDVAESNIHCWVNCSCIEEKSACYLLYSEFSISIQCGGCVVRFGKLWLASAIDRGCPIRWSVLWVIGDGV